MFSVCLGSLLFSQNHQTVSLISLTPGNAIFVTTSNIVCTPNLRAQAPLSLSIFFRFFLGQMWSGIETCAYIYYCPFACWPYTLQQLAVICFCTPYVVHFWVEAIICLLLVCEWSLCVQINLDILLDEVISSVFSEVAFACVLTHSILCSKYLV